MRVLCSSVLFTAVAAGTGEHCSGPTKPNMKDFNDVQVSRSMQQCQLVGTRWHSRTAVGEEERDAAGAWGALAAEFSCPDCLAIAACKF